MSDAPLWTFDALVAAAGGRIIGTTAGEIAGISIDTRTIKPGEAFFAIKGDRVDGHNYVANAVAAGATISVVAESKIKMMPKDAVLLVVPDVLGPKFSLEPAIHEFMSPAWKRKNALACVEPLAQ